MKKVILLLFTLVCFGLAQAQTAYQARWYNKQNTYTYRSLSCTTTDTSLLSNNVLIHNYDTNYYAVVWIKNNTANDFATGDSIKVAFRINGTLTDSHKLTLTKPLLKDSITYFILNDYVLVNGVSQWGTNNYCYNVIAYNTTSVTDTASACMSFYFYRKAITVSDVFWLNKIDSTTTNSLSYSTYDDSLLIKYTAAVSNFQPNYIAQIKITNNTGADMAIGDSIKIATYINGVQTAIRSVTIPFVFHENNTTTLSINENILVPNRCQWGNNIISYKVVEINGVAQTDYTTNNYVNFTFNQLPHFTGLTVFSVRWYDTITTMSTSGLTYTTKDDSLLDRNVVSIKSLIPNYRAIVGIKNNTGQDIPIGDSIKVNAFMNGNKITTWQISLSKPLLKDSVSYYTIDESIIIPGNTQWGTNSFCYKVIKYNNIPADDSSTNNCMPFTFQKALNNIVITNVAWLNRKNNTLSKTHTMYSLDDSLLIKYQKTIQNIDTNYLVALQITNKTNNTLAAGDSIKVRMTINGTQVLTRTIKLSKALPIDSSTYFTVNEYVIIPNSCQWGDNTYCYEITRYNGTLVSDSSTNNCMTFTFQKAFNNLNIAHVRWYNTQTSLTTSRLTYTSSDDSLLLRNIMHIQSLDSNYKSAIWIKNNTSTDLAAGDSIKVSISINGKYVSTWKLTLNRAVLKDSTISLTLNEYLIVPGFTQWGTNSYCYKVTQYNTTPIVDSTTNNCMTFVFQKPITDIAVTNVEWLDKQNNTLSKTHSMQSTDDSLFTNIATIQNIDTNYIVSLQITNGTENTLAAGDSIKVTLSINGIQVQTRTLILQNALPKDSSTSFNINEYVIVPNLCQWGDNTYCYKVVRYNTTPVTDNSFNNCMTFTFNKVIIPPLTNITVTNAAWANIQNNTLTKAQTIQSSNHSLFDNATTISNIDANYLAAIRITNGSGQDLVAGDSIKVTLSINGIQVKTRTLTLSSTLLKDSARYFTLDEEIIVPSISQWGTNTYCYEVVSCNETPIMENSTDNCMTFTFENTTSIVENTLENVKIYPNPVRNVLHINNVENANIDIYNIVGQKVKFIKNVTGNEDIDVSDMSNGMYILRMQDGQNTRVERIQVVK